MILMNYGDLTIKGDSTLDGHADWGTPEARALIKHYIDKASGAGAS